MGEQMGKDPLIKYNKHATQDQSAFSLLSTRNSISNGKEGGDVTLDINALVSRALAIKTVSFCNRYPQIK